MKQLMTVVLREYRTRVSTPMFLVSTTLMLIILVGGPALGYWWSNATSSNSIEVQTVDHTGYLLGHLQRRLSDAQASPAPEARPRTSFTFHEAPLHAQEALLTQATAGEIEALLVIHGKTPDQISVTVASSNALTIDKVRSGLIPELEQAIHRARLVSHRVDVSVIEQLQRPVEVEYIRLTSGGDDSGYSTRVTIAAVFNFIMYIAILLYAASTFQGVLEEKVSRVMEVLLAAVKPDVLIGGKVLGIGLVGMTQLTILSLPYWVLVTMPLGLLSRVLAELNPIIFLFMILYFLLGFVFYASLYAAAASTVSRIEDSQSAMTPLTLFIIAGYFISLFALLNPNGPFAVAASMTPFFAPTVMLTRLALADPPLWQLLISIVLLALSTWLAAMVAARIYRLGVLLYGTQPGFRVIWRHLVANP
jgi:ABC-2 type transport system permease protein